MCLLNGHAYFLFLPYSILVMFSIDILKGRKHVAYERKIKLDKRSIQERFSTYWYTCDHSGFIFFFFCNIHNIIVLKYQKHTFTSELQYYSFLNIQSIIGNKYILKTVQVIQNGLLHIINSIGRVKKIMTCISCLIISYYCSLNLYLVFKKDIHVRS